VNWSAPGLDPSLALPLPARRLLASRTSALLVANDLLGNLFLHHLAGHLIPDLDRPFFHRSQQAAVLAGRYLSKFYLQLPGKLLDPKP
jgi:hypothetical protein